MEADNTKQYSCGEHNDVQIEVLDVNNDQTDDSQNQTEELGNICSKSSNLASLAAAHKAMKSLKDLVPCEFSREEITHSADELINSLNAKRKRDSEIIEDFKKTCELQTSRSCTLIEQHIFKIYEKQGKTIQDKIQELYAVLDRISKLEKKIQEFKRALQGLCFEFND
ncbi:synaptonemal complex central element protein 2-like [Mytilus edulis]|uniref:synaptonemal complex central element protein 2-like n=1 Tax=Mytilus edulis TaxID=6550 RepID=UPI0039EFC85B